MIEGQLKLYPRQARSLNKATLLFPHLSFSNIQETSAEFAALPLASSRGELGRAAILSNGGLRKGAPASAFTEEIWYDGAVPNGFYW